MRTRERRNFSLKNRVNVALPKRIRIAGLLFFLFFLCCLPQNAISEELSDLERCMLEAMETDVREPVEVVRTSHSSRFGCACSSSKMIPWEFFP